ncbi:MAG: hypothetical protein F4Y88_06280 [Chloroflexi bacterium]|nr:hypothetical protein [Chloroflexota bacterium]
MKSRLKLAQGVALIGVIIVVGTLLLEPGASALAQKPTPQPTGSIQEITASTPNLTLTVGDTVVLSINVIGRQDIEDQRLADDIKFDWSVSGGQLSDGADGTSVSYTAPADPGIYSVTVSPRSGCVGTGLACTATFRLTVRRPGEATGPDAPPRNPEGEIPAILTASGGGQYEVFTPEEGGTFTSENFSVSAGNGIVPNDEIIGVRMAEDGSASNAGMSHHRYTLSGNQYRVSVIDAERAPILSYNLNGTVAVCIPVPGELRTNISSLEMVTKNSNGTLTVMSSSVRISPSLIICGNTSTLPATIAVGIRGTPPPLLEPDPEPTEMLPATGGATPSSASALVWAFLLGIALISIGTLCLRILDRDEFNRA